MSQIDSLPPLREVIAAHGLRAKKELGQNFLLDLNLTARIARVGGALEEVRVIEVGPGPGGLTRALLAEGAREVIAIERDARALPALAEIEAAYPGRLTVIGGDAMEMNYGLLAAGRTQIIANLPYNIGTQLLTGWLTMEPWPPFFESLTLMFQREVAERICAKPGDEAYGRLAVLAGWRTEARIAFNVGRQAFVPPPNVTSAVVHLVPKPVEEGLPGETGGTGDQGRLRAAPQDGAPVAEIAGRAGGGPARGGGSQGRRARRGPAHRGVPGDGTGAAGTEVGRAGTRRAVVPNRKDPHPRSLPTRGREEED